jgi:CcmD family protein
MRLRILAIVALATVLLTVAAPPLSAQQPPPKPQEGFVPIDQLPPQEELPASRMLIAAYSVAWIAVFGYLWSIGQRLGKVEHEIAEARRRVEAGGRR